MYVGRIVAIGMTHSGRKAALYRVSSRSFPNREARLAGNSAFIMPKSGFEKDLNESPYIAYCCLRIVGDWAVVSNGSHTDPIAEKIASGMTPRDAFGLSLLAMDYEKDNYNTPRIAGAIHATGNCGWLGVVRHDGLEVRKFTLKPGSLFYLATYEKDSPSVENCDNNFESGNALSACGYILGDGVFAGLEKPVTAAAALHSTKGFETAVSSIS